MIRLAALCLLLLAGCNNAEKQAAIEPAELTEEALGHYCQMYVLEHSGPKAQVHLAGQDTPIWFVQIRDAFAFDRMPEQDAKVAAIFVNDMGARGAAWDDPGSDNWIAASEAVYVTGSRKLGGMGAPDFIPFGDRQAAMRFADLQGGTVVTYDEIDDAAVLSPVEVDLEAAGSGEAMTGHDHQ